MSEDFDNPDANDPESGPKQLREYAERKAREADEAQARLAALERKDLFRDAGLDPSNQLHAAVMNGYGGELSVEQVKAFVEGTGVLATASTPPPEPQAAPIPPDEQAAFQRMADASRGGGVPPDENAVIDQQMHDLTERATKERWTSGRYQQEMAALAGMRGEVSWDGPQRG